VADSTRGEEPLEFFMGDGTLIDGLERVLLDLEVGTKQTFEIEPLYAFGFADPQAVHVLPRSDFPDDMEVAAGTIIGFQTPGGEELPGIIKAVEGDTVTVDFSHPLAGHTLTFDVEVLAVRPRGTPTPEAE
jgi:FKBP-type peptidyl-prolyl cis-trans isomerase SlpA